LLAEEPQVTPEVLAILETPVTALRAVLGLQHHLLFIVVAMARILARAQDSEAPGE
jgi:hypothetical protein